MAASDVGIAWTSVILVIFEVLLVWGLLYDLITNILYNIALAAGGGEQTLDMIVLFYQWMPVPFLFGVIVWAVVVSARAQGDSQGW